MPLAAGFVGILPALGLLDEERDGVPALHLTWLDAVGWSLAVAFFGQVYFSVISNLPAQIVTLASFFRRRYVSKWYASLLNR